jgi:hypothetical protein
MSHADRYEICASFLQGKPDLENYSGIKNEDILSFAGKWMEIDNTILREVTQTQNDMYGMYSLISGY